MLDMQQTPLQDTCPPTVTLLAAARLGRALLRSHGTQWKYRLGRFV